jgi:hypothetical protein
MDQFRRWIAAGVVRWLDRWSAGDARKALRISAALIFLSGVLAGVFFTSAASQPAVLVLVAAGALSGYAARSFVSYRRRQAARRDFL